MAFAEDTKVPVEKTRAELDSLLMRAGADQRMTGVDDAKGLAFVVFNIADRRVRLTIPLPKRTERRFTHDGNGKLRRPDALIAAYEQGCRSRWRAVLLLTKAKIEAIALGISTVEREFLADIFLPDGQTVGEALKPQLAESYASGRMPPLLPGPREDG